MPIDGSVPVLIGFAVLSGTTEYDHVPPLSELTAIPWPVTPSERLHRFWGTYTVPSGLTLTWPEIAPHGEVAPKTGVLGLNVSPAVSLRPQNEPTGWTMLCEQ